MYVYICAYSNIHIHVYMYTAHTYVSHLFVHLFQIIDPTNHLLLSLPEI